MPKQTGFDRKIGNPLEADPDWFNTLFEHLGVDARIDGLTAKSIGTGQIGENVRFEFSIARGADNLRTTIVGKFPSLNEMSRATAKLLGHYEREVRFYETFPVANEIAPYTLYTAYDASDNDFVLLMEDLAPAVQGDQLKGCSLADGELAIDRAAILHAKHWNDPDLDQYAWLQGTEAAPPEAITPAQVAGLWVAFKQKYASGITPEIEQVGDVYAAYLSVAHEDDYSGPMTLSHGDYRLDNMLFHGNEKPLAIVDWQTVGKKGAAADIAYFIGAGFTQEDRPKYEEGLLKRYHEKLALYGVTYPYEDLLKHYALFSFNGMGVAFGAAMLVQQTARGDEMFLTMLRRHAAQAKANGGLEVLEALMR